MRVVLVVALVVLTGCGTRTAVPKQDARRIDAEFGAWTLLPQWVPKGFRFASWHVDRGGPAGSERLVLHFRRGTGDLRWEVALRSWLRDKRVRCPQRTIRVESGFAWMCGDVAISASATGLSGGDLRRVVASNHTIAPWHVPPPGYILAPAAIARAEGFVPRRLPPGYLYTSRSTFRAYDGWTYRTLTFGRAGARLDWSVVSGRSTDPPTECPGRAADAHAVASRTVYVGTGNHGQGAWVCLSPTRELQLSEEGFAVSRRELMELVARFRRA